MMFEVVFGGEVPMFHHRIVELRKKKKMTQETLAEKIGVTRSALSQYELGTRQPDYEIIKNIADYFGVTTDDLLGRKENASIEGTVNEIEMFKDFKDLDSVDQEYISGIIKTIKTLKRK